jgi:hypothetical protein
MTRLTRHLLAIGVVIFPAFLPTSNSVACTSSGDCQLPLQCLPGLFGGFCAFALCNSDSDCRNGSLCETGFCPLAGVTLIAIMGKSARTGFANR